MAWFDTHCHLDFLPFSDELAKNLTEFELHDIQLCMVPAVGPQNWQTVLSLAEHPMLKVGLGYHPCFLERSALLGKPEQLLPQLDTLDQLVYKHRQTLSAWGECGLDGRFPETLAHQEFAFVQQIVAAKKHRLPLLVHSVRLHDRLAQLIKQQQFDVGGIIHGFSGSYTQASRFVDLGFKIGVGGGITWPRSEKTRKALRRLPIDALVLETDAPDMPLYQMTTEHNTPLHLAAIFQCLSELRSESHGQLKHMLWSNSLQVLNLST
ncbi:TatD family hydrolase [Agarivorans sp. MS3-6]